MTTDTSWIQPGMTVVIYQRRAVESNTATVVRLTPTQIVLRAKGGAELRYRRDNGTKVGDYNGGGELRPTTDPGWLRQRGEMRRRAALGAVRTAHDAIRHDIGDPGRERLLALQAAVTAALAVFDEPAAS